MEVQEEAVRSAPGRFFMRTEILLCCLFWWFLIFELEHFPAPDWLKRFDKTDCRFGIRKVPGEHPYKIPYWIDVDGYVATSRDYIFSLL